MIKSCTGENEEKVMEWKGIVSKWKKKEVSENEDSRGRNRLREEGEKKKKKKLKTKLCDLFAL